MIEIYCDGSANPNPGPGGYGVAVLDGKNLIYSKSYKSYRKTTNNEMELSALIHAIKYARKNPFIDFTIYCDSAYVVNSWNYWIDSWANNGWRRAGNKPIENLDLMKKLYEFRFKDGNFPNYKVVKVKGHVNIVGNELADSLSNQNYTKYFKTINQNDLKVVAELSKTSSNDIL